MPPNIKFPVNLPLGDELINVAQSGSQAAPPPLTLDHYHSSDDDDFFLHDMEDIEEDIGDLEEPSPPVSQQHEQADHEHAKASTHSHDQEHRHNAHRVIRHLASQVSDPTELDIDSKRLGRAVREAGEFAYGVIACEVWMLEDDKLIRPRGGWWHNEKLVALENLALVEPNKVMPGVDLPGILWAESHRDGSRGNLRTSHSSFFGRPGGQHRSTNSLDPNHQQEHQIHGAHSPPHSDQAPSLKPSGSSNGFFGRPGPSMEDLASFLHFHPHHTSTNNPHALMWRDLHSLAQDPDSAKTPRLGELIDAGLCAAAGVPFHINNHTGLVIYFARSHTRTHLLSNVANDAFLRASAEMIGHAAAISEMRRASVEARRRQNKQAVERFRNNLLEFHRNKDARKVDAVESPRCDLSETKSQDHDYHDTLSLDLDLPPDEGLLEKALKGMHTWWHKCHGGNLQVPPALTIRQTLWTILGAFCGLLVLSSLNEYYKILSDEDYFLLIGPFGALMTLQYGLTAAPASQPRNAILGQAVSGAVSLAFTYIPESILAVWLRRAVGPAVAIGAMVKLGVTHPPAGAHAVLYASGQYNFGFYALVVLSSAISVIPATLVNNLSSKRQYPTYWTIIPLAGFCGSPPKEPEK